MLTRDQKERFRSVVAAIIGQTQEGLKESRKENLYDALLSAELLSGETIDLVRVSGDDAAIFTKHHIVSCSLRPDMEWRLLPKEGVCGLKINPAPWAAGVEGEHFTLTILFKGNDPLQITVPMYEGQAELLRLSKAVCPA
jgi:hypothetical protein